MNTRLGCVDSMAMSSATLFDRASQSFHRRSISLVTFLEVRMHHFTLVWLVAILAIGVLKVAFAPTHALGMLPAAAMMLPYLLISAAPIAGYLITTSCFPRDHLSPQPAIRLCRYGRWRDLDFLSARTYAAFGPAGFVASLLVGLLLNIPFRSVEFLLAVPAVAPQAPAWAHTILQVMTADVVIMNFFYMVCFVMALRSIPLFPRMLLFGWAVDFSMQLCIAKLVSAAPDLPPTVVPGLLHLLSGNMEKVLISVFVWLPYLILSDRINLTFRRRIRI